MSQGNRRFSCPVCKKVSMEGKVCKCDIAAFLHPFTDILPVRGTQKEISISTFKARLSEAEKANEYAEARIASLIRLNDASDLAIQERNELIPELRCQRDAALAEVERLRARIVKLEGYFTASELAGLNKERSK